MKRLFSNTFAVILLLCGSISVFAIATIDPAFNAVPSSQFADSTPLKQITQPDGKVIVWGALISANGLAKGQIARLNTDGTVDTSFTYCACQGFASVESVALQGDGKMLLSGANISSRGQVSRINSDGSADNTYSQVFSGAVPPNGGGSAYIWAVLPDNKALIERFDSTQGFSQRSLYRLNTDGSVDPAFTVVAIGAGQLIQTFLTALAVAPDGKIYIGRTTSSGGGTSASLLRRNADGTTDNWEAPSLTTGGQATQTSVASLAVQSDGSLLVSGNFDAVNGAAKSKVARLFSAGNVDMGFSAPAFFSTGTIKILANGKFLISATTGLGNPSRLYRLNADGSQDNTFVLDPAILSVNNKFVVDGLDRALFFGTSSSGSSVFRVDVNGTQDASFNSSIAAFGSVQLIARQADGKILVAGGFSRMNTTARPSFARLNADGTTDTTFDPGTGFSSLPRDLVVQADGKIIAGGSFTTYNGAAVSGLIRINSNGTLDSGFAPAVTSVNSISFQTDGKLLIGGSFATVNGDARSRVARLNADGTTDLTFNASITSGSVNAAQQLADGKIIVGGSFTGVDGFNRSNFVRLNANGTLDSVFNPASPPSINKIYIQPDGKYLYIGGNQTIIGRRNADGSNDTSFAAPTFTVSGSRSLMINAMAVQSDGSIIVGGFFNSVNGVARNSFARFSSLGVLDRYFFPVGVTGAIYALTNEPGGALLLGGDFWRIETTVRAGIARVIPGLLARPVPFDYDGDGRADVSVFRASTNQWYILRSSDSAVLQTTFAIAGDVPSPADFDGDGKTDIAIFRPSSNDWWSLSSLNGQQVNARWGVEGSVPLPSDFDGDGKTDYVVFLPASNQWLRASSVGGASSNRTFGLAGDKPVIGDFDGDGKSDVAIYRPSDGNWWWQSSVDNVQRATRWGISTDIPSPADFDGDGKTDFAVYRPSAGVWYVYNSSTGSASITGFGTSEDKPVAADYDGDGKADLGVFRPSDRIWYLLGSTAGFTGYQFGISTDRPTPNSFVP